jgi:hypothetical protein
MRTLRIVSIVLAILSLAMPLAHLLELPNKLALDGPLWLAVQQNLYRGWGPFWGGPIEFLALMTSTVLLILSRDGRTRRLMIVASLAYAGMIASFFFLNRPVNESVMRWAPRNLPQNWASYRTQWELGHSVAFLLSMLGLYTTLRAHIRCALE